MVTHVDHRWEMNNPSPRAKYAEAQPEICRLLLLVKRMEPEATKFDSPSFLLNRGPQKMAVFLFFRFSASLEGNQKPW